MDCPKCGESMKKGCICVSAWDRFYVNRSIEWYNEESMEKYGGFLKLF